MMLERTAALFEMENSKSPALFKSPWLLKSSLQTRLILRLESGVKPRTKMVLHWRWQWLYLHSCVCCAIEQKWRSDVMGEDDQTWRQPPEEHREHQQHSHLSISLAS